MYESRDCVRTQDAEDAAMVSESDDDEKEATRAPLMLEVVATEIADIGSEARSEAARQLALHAGVRAEAITFNADMESALKEHDETMTTATALAFADEVHDAAVAFLTTGADAAATTTTAAAASAGAAAANPREKRAELVAAIMGHAIAVWRVKVEGRSVTMIVSEMGTGGEALHAALQAHKGHKAASTNMDARAEVAAAYAHAEHPLTVICREVGPMAAVPKKMRGLPMLRIEEDVKTQLSDRLVDKATGDGVSVWRKDMTRPGTKGGSMPNAIDSAILTLAAAKPMKDILIAKDEQPPDPKRGLMQLPRVTMKVGVVTTQSALAARAGGAAALKYEEREMRLFECVAGATRPAIHVPGMMLGVHGAMMITDRNTTVDIVRQHQRAQARLRAGTWPIYKEYCEIEYAEARSALGEAVKTPLEEVCSLGIIKTLVHYKDARRGDPTGVQYTQPCDGNGCHGQSFTCHEGEKRPIPEAIVTMLEASIAKRAETTRAAEGTTTMPEPRQARGSNDGGRGTGGGWSGGRGGKGQGGKGGGGASGTPPQAREARGQCGRCGRQKAEPEADGKVPERMCDGVQCLNRQPAARAKARNLADRMQPAGETAEEAAKEAEGAAGGMEAEAAAVEDRLEEQPEGETEGDAMAQPAPGRAQEATAMEDGTLPPAAEAATTGDDAPPPTPEAEATTTGGGTEPAAEMTPEEIEAAADKDVAEIEAMDLERTYQEKAAAGELTGSESASRGSSRASDKRERETNAATDGPMLGTVDEEEGEDDADGEQRASKPRGDGGGEAGGSGDTAPPKPKGKQTKKSTGKGGKAKASKPGSRHQ